MGGVEIAQIAFDLPLEASISGMSKECAEARRAPATCTPAFAFGRKH